MKEPDLAVIVSSRRSLQKIDQTRHFTTKKQKSQLPAIHHRAGQRPRIEIIKVAARRDAAGESRYFGITISVKLCGELHGGGFGLGSTGEREDDFGGRIFCHAVDELGDTEIVS